MSWFNFASAGRALPKDFRVRNTWHIVNWDPRTDLNNTDAIGRFAVGGYGGRLAITNDGGYHWFIKTLLGTDGFPGFILSPAWTANGYLYVASESPIAGSVRMLKSTDFANTFSRADFGLPDIAAHRPLGDRSMRAPRRACCASMPTA